MDSSLSISINNKKLINIKKKKIICFVLLVYAKLNHGI